MCFYIFGSLYSSWANWANVKFENTQTRVYQLIEEPNIFLSGCVGGVVGRALVLPLDSGGAKGMGATLYRQSPRTGLLMAIYLPTSAWNQRNKRNPYKKAKTTMWTGFVAGSSMRLLSNPFTAVRDNVTAERNVVRTARHMYESKGWTSFWRGQHPIFVCGVYYGFTFMFMEAFRGWFNNNMGITGDVANAFVNGTAATAATVTASVIIYPLAKWRYEKVFRRESAVTLSPVRAVLKEAPQFGAAIFTFSLLMPVVAPHWERCGFGK